MSSNNEEIDNFFETLLTPEEYKYLQRKLPKGFALIQPNKNNRNSKAIKGFSNHPGMSINSSEMQMGDATPDDGAQRREHRSTRVVRNMDHEMPYTTQKLPKNVMDALKKCKNILAALKKHRSATPFLRPVDPTQLNCPDYFTIITEPMDLGTVEKKLRNNSYNSPYQFFSDVRRIWSNAFTYNPRNSLVHNMTIEISQYFEDLYKQIEMPMHEDLSMLENKVTRLENKLKELNTRKTTGGKTSGGPGTVNGNPLVGTAGSTGGSSIPGVIQGPATTSGSAKDNMDKAMSFQEKKALTMMIKNLHTGHLKGVWQIVCNDNPSLSMKKELVIDIERLPTRTARELEKYVKSKISSSQKANKKKTKKNPLGFIGEGTEMNANEFAPEQSAITDENVQAPNFEHFAAPP